MVAPAPTRISVVHQPACLSSKEHAFVSTKFPENYWKVAQNQQGISTNVLVLFAGI